MKPFIAFLILCSPIAAADWGFGGPQRDWGFGHAAHQPNEPLRDDGLDIALRNAIEDEFPGALGGGELPEDAEAAPTPYVVLFQAVKLLNLTNEDTLVDYGCGSDARVLVHAFHKSGCRGVGIEIDRDRSTTSRNRIRSAGLNPWIDIVHGNALEVDVEGTAGFAYLWENTLERLRPKIEQLDRFVSYAHKVPGLSMKRIDVPGHEPLWYWEQTPEVTYIERPYAVYNGNKHYGGRAGCNCEMCRQIRDEIASRQNVERIPVQPRATPAQSSTRTQAAPVFSSNCRNGRCSRGGFFRSLFR